MISGPALVSGGKSALKRRKQAILQLGGLTLSSDKPSDDTHLHDCCRRSASSASRQPQTGPRMGREETAESITREEITQTALSGRSRWSNRFPLSPPWLPPGLIAPPPPGKGDIKSRVPRMRHKTLTLQLTPSLIASIRCETSRAFRRTAWYTGSEQGRSTESW